MIVTKYKTIVTESGSGQFACAFTRDSRTPGLVILSTKNGSINLPGNPEDAARLIAAYRAAVDEDVGYQSVEVPDPAKPAVVLPIR
jgi:hypothetical protein